MASEEPKSPTEEMLNPTPTGADETPAEIDEGRSDILAIVQSDQTFVELPSGRRSISDLVEGLAGSLSRGDMLAFIEALIAKQGVDDFKDLLEVLEIFRTETAFTDPEKVKILEETAGQYGLRFWAEQQGKDLTTITRDDLDDWWGFFTQMAAAKGYNPGGIDKKSQQNNLWKATAALARKMSENPAAYRFLPAYLINNPQEVARALSEIVQPIAFLEVLTGEAWEDMCRSQLFLGAFAALSKDDEVDNPQELAIATVMLALQRQ